MQHVRSDVLINTTLASSYSYILNLDSIDLVSLQAVYTNATTSGKVFTVLSLANNTVTITAHGQVTGSLGQVSNSGGGLPAGLAAITNYYVIVVDANTVKFATSLANAVAGTEVDITGNGTGTQTFTPTTSAGNVLKLQGGNDGTNFSDLAGDTVTIATTSGNSLWDLGSPGYRYVNIVYTPSAGQIALTVTINAKSDK